MKLRHAAALFGRVWGYVPAALLVALALAEQYKRLDRRFLDWIASDPQSFLRHEQHVHSLSFIFWTIEFCGFGIAYVVVVENLAWCFREGARFLRRRAPRTPS
jgi:hypothetical protein